MTEAGMALCRDPEVAWVGDEQRAVLVRVARHDPTPLVLEASAAAIWAVLGEPSTLEDVVDAVARRYGVESGEVRADVEAFVREAMGLGIVLSGGEPQAGSVT